MPNGKQSPGKGPQGGKTKGLPKPQPVQYFEADGETLKAELLDEVAESIARKLADLAKHQLRRFYDHVQAIDRKLQLEAGGGADQKREAAFARLRAELLMLRAKAVYACGRKTIPTELLQFILDHTHSVQNSRDFDAFRRHFEAVVGFHGYFARE